MKIEVDVKDVRAAANILSGARISETYRQQLIARLRTAIEDQRGRKTPVQQIVGRK